jgi:hypothetical protein
VSPSQNAGDAGGRDTPLYQWYPMVLYQPLLGMDNNGRTIKQTWKFCVLDNPLNGGLKISTRPHLIQFCTWSRTCIQNLPGSSMSESSFETNVNGPWEFAQKLHLTLTAAVSKPNIL